MPQTGRAVFLLAVNSCLRQQILKAHGPCCSSLPHLPPAKRPVTGAQRLQPQGFAPNKSTAPEHTTDVLRTNTSTGQRPPLAQ